MSIIQMWFRNNDSLGDRRGLHADVRCGDRHRLDREGGPEASECAVVGASLSRAPQRGYLNPRSRFEKTPDRRTAGKER